MNKLKGHVDCANVSRIGSGAFPQYTIQNPVIKLVTFRKRMCHFKLDFQVLKAWTPLPVQNVALWKEIMFLNGLEITSKISIYIYNSYFYPSISACTEDETSWQLYKNVETQYPRNFWSQYLYQSNRIFQWWLLVRTIEKYYWRFRGFYHLICSNCKHFFGS